MSLNFRLGQIEQVVPCLAPVDAVATEKDSTFVALKGAQRISFLLFFGVITAASADQVITVTVQCASSAASTSELPMPFLYRVSGAVGTDTWGAIVAATTAGFTVDTTAQDNKLYLIDVDPHAVPAIKANASYVRLEVVPDAGGSATLCSIIAIISPRYAATNMLSTS
jgi:hypothetical protein